MKDIGTLAEMKFVTRALQYNLRVSLPVGDNSDYDCIIDHNGKLKKIQIKSTNTHYTDKRSDCYKVGAARGSGRKLVYSSKTIDYFAVYVHPLDCWYIIPVDEVGTFNIRVYPHRLGIGKYEQWKERWEILLEDHP